MIPQNKQPLFIVTGASGVGKSTLCEELFKKEEQYIVLESDILWDERFNTPENHYLDYRKLWLTLCANISQIGKPVVLCGCNTPEQLETLEERQLFTDIYYLAIVASDDMLFQRMTTGRNITDLNWIQSSLDFNQWLKTNHLNTTPTITILDVTDLTLEESAKKVDEWIMMKLGI